MLLSYIIFGGLSILAFYMFITEGISKHHFIYYLDYACNNVLLSNVALVVNKKSICYKKVEK